MPYYHVRVGESQHQRDSSFYYSRDMKTLAERLIWAREKREMSQQTLANRVGVSQSTIGNLEAGIRQTARKLPQIAHALAISALWLAEGRGEPFAEGSVNTPPVEPTLPAKEVLELLAIFSKCDAEGRKFIMDAAHTMAADSDLFSSDDQLKHG